jgi:hypothetical protein
MDLNGDNQSEYLLTSASDCECGQVNCSQWVYRSHNGALQFLLQAEGYVLNARDTSHNGYLDLETASRNNAVIIDHNIYTFNGTKYERAESRIENLDTHESKPTLQRIRFAARKSSATVTGSASPSYSDSWVLAAKKGLTLQLAITRTNGVATSFTLLAPGVEGGDVIADSQSKWSGVLPQSGIYTIVVGTNGDGKGSYRMTVAIP